MEYNKVQTKLTSGKEERIISETTYFRFDGHDKKTIETWLSTNSILRVLKCLLKCWWNREAIREKAVRNIDTHKQYEATKDSMIEAYRAQLREKGTGAEAPIKKEESS